MITHFKLSYAYHNFHIPKVTTKRSHSITFLLRQNNENPNVHVTNA